MRRTSKKAAKARSVPGAFEFNFSISMKHFSPLAAFVSNAAAMAVSLCSDGDVDDSSFQKSSWSTHHTSYNSSVEERFTQWRLAVSRFGAKCRQAG